ncbi:MAG: hypothetical protein OCD03_08310 [Hyphomicrobiales bacterium]
MWDFSIGQAFSLMLKTTPFILFRAAVYFGIAVAYVVVTGVGAGIGYGIGNFGDAEFQGSATLWGGGLGLGLTAGVIYFLREYILYIVKAGHIAVMVELMEGGEIPNGIGQVAYAKTIVTQRFGQSSILFAVDQLIKGVLKGITGLVQGILTILPIPGVSQIMNIVRAFLKISVGLMDEVILAHSMRTKADNPWLSAREALVLYGQNARPIMVNAAWLTAIVYMLSFLVFLVMLAPAAAVVFLIPGAWAAGGVVFALIFAWAIKAAFIEPFAIACMLQVYFKVTEGQVPDPEWMRKIEGASQKFKKLGERAGNWAGKKVNL